MQQVEIEIVYAAMLQLLLKNRLHIRRILKIPQRQLGRQLKGAPGVPPHQRLPHGLFAVIAVVGVGGIEIGKALLQKRIEKLLDERKVEGGRILPVQQRQTHTPKAQRFLFKNTHVPSSWFA